MTQDALFPMTQLDIAQAFLAHFEKEVEKRLKAVLSANDKLLDVQKLRDMAEAELRRAQDGSRASVVDEVQAELDAMVAAGDVTLTIDPVTGEVTT